MEKEILQEYIDACELVKETEQEISKIKRKKKTIAQDHVRGSNPEFPYQGQSFHVEGIQYTYSDDQQLRAKERILEQQKNRAEEVKLSVEAWMNTISLRMQRIIKYKYFEGLSWEEVADKMGRKATGKSVQKEFERFMKND